MSDPGDPVAARERVRELEDEIAELRRGLDDDSAGPETGATVKCLEIGVSGTAFLVPIDEIREVVPMAWPEPVTGAPPWVMGTISYGGIPTTLIDLGMRISDEETGLNPNLLVVVVESERWLGLVVSSAGDVHTIDAAELITPGTEIPCARFLLGLVRRDGLPPAPLLSVRKVGRDLDG